MEVAQALGKYELRGTLGRGAMGTVYDGWDPIIARRVAIKTVSLPDHPDPETEEEIARFRREAQAAGRLTHPKIVAIYDYGETADVAYIVMEYVDGPTLKSLLDKHERFALPDIQRVMDDLLAGLQFSHDRGVVHRDIKPANVMLTSGGQGKIADFGIARIESSNMTQAGTVLGTPAYMSPEQFMGQVVDPRTDIYSSGVLLYQLLTGERPFEGSVTAIMHKVLNTDPPAPSALSVTAPAALDAVVRRAMAKRPEDRYPSASAFAAAIRAALAAPAEAAVADGDATMIAPSRTGATQVMRPADGPPPATPAVGPGTTAAAARPRPMAAILGTVLGVLLLAGGGAWWFLSRTPTPAPVTHVAAPPPAPAPVAVLPKPAPPPVAATQPAASPAAVAPPVPAPPSAPAFSPAALRAQLAAAIGANACALVDPAVAQNGDVTVTGLAGQDAAASLRTTLTGIAGAHPMDWRVQALQPVFCPALSLLRPISPLAGAPALGLRLRLAGGQTTLHDGARILPRLTMPRFAGYARVDYLGHDGSVVHLYPTVADPAQNFAAVPGRVLGPERQLALGDGGPREPLWEVGPPYGTDMIIAVVSSVPLLRTHPPANIEDSATNYLHRLEAAIAAARAAGGQVTATALPVDTLPPGK